VRHDRLLEGAVVVVVPCGRERADDVHRLTQTAFAAYATLDPPSGAIRETVEVVRGDLGAGGGAIAEIDSVAVGCLAFYRSLGYEVVGERRHDGYDRTTWLALRKPLRPMGI
jgi:hypothetical protein